MKVRAGRQLSALVEAGMVLASELDLDALLQRIADLSREVVGASYGAVGVVGTDSQLARFVYSGIDQETADQIGELPSGRGVLGALLEQNRPLRLRSTDQGSKIEESGGPVEYFCGSSPKSMGISRAVEHRGRFALARLFANLRAA
ncbi:MAG: hypothetical protein ABI571_08035 [Actinomycetota bacterium]